MTRRELFAAVAAAIEGGRWERAESLLRKAAEEKMPRAMSFYYAEGGSSVSRSFGEAKADSKFLIASISKPMTVAGVMWLVDRKKIGLEDPASKYLPDFKGGDREKVLVRHLLSHTCGLPDMLPENSALRQRNAPLSEYVALALKTPMLFAPGTKWSYSSTGILLASEIVRRAGGWPIAKLLEEEIYKPLGMRDTAMGLGRFRLDEVVRSQTEHAPADLGGATGTQTWDWNSAYWRGLGAPWGGAHSTAGDIAKFLRSFLEPGGKPLSRESAQAMTRNQNPSGVAPYAFGFSLGARLSEGLPAEAFGHGGSTGTLCWANPAKRAVFVLLTSLPDAVARKRIIQPVSKIFTV
jgi:CubicO group peptidase (beta-lactamase class C family)